MPPQSLVVVGDVNDMVESLRIGEARTNVLVAQVQLQLSYGWPHYRMDTGRQAQTALR